jgi:glycosyltransferase involved in cell wall biosynthesis
MAIAFAFVLFAAVAVLCLTLVLGAGSIPELKDSPPADDADAPSVSIVVTALNEADTIAPALRSLLAIDYPRLEVIVINDRSTDATPQILERMAAEHAALRVLHIGSLPAGWLGKNHALQRGAEIASGEYLVFTDADVLFAPDAVSRAAACCRKLQLDHLTLLFDVVARTQLLRAMLLSFALAFMVRFQPWKVDGSPERFVGVGGFNMVRRSAYFAAGGHAAIRLAVLDDLELGRLIKRSGHSQRLLLGTDMVTVEWYRSTPELGRGIEKNIFAGFDYRLSQLAAVTLLILAARVWPWIALFVTQGLAFWLYLATIAASLALYARLARRRGWSLRCLLFMPVVPLIELWMWWKGALLVLLRGGVVWRGTFYPLTEIRQAHRRAIRRKSGSA